MCVCISLVCLASKCMTAHLLAHQFIPGDNCVKSVKSVKLVISVNVFKHQGTVCVFFCREDGNIVTVLASL